MNCRKRWFPFRWWPAVGRKKRHPGPGDTGRNGSILIVGRRGDDGFLYRCPKATASGIEWEEDILDRSFADAAGRDRAFKREEQRLVNENKDALFRLKDGGNRPLVLEIEVKLIDWLTKEEGFTQVVTPIILPGSMLEKMTIGADHPLTKQVFWLDNKRCLRPMLAPNLYHMMRELKRIWESGAYF